METEFCETITTAAAAHKVPAKAKRAPADLCRRAGGAACRGDGECEVGRWEGMEVEEEALRLLRGCVWLEWSVGLVAFGRKETFSRRAQCGCPISPSPRTRARRESRRGAVPRAGQQPAAVCTRDSSNYRTICRFVRAEAGEGVKLVRALVLTETGVRPSRCHPSSVPPLTAPVATLHFSGSVSVSHVRLSSVHAVYENVELSLSATQEAQQRRAQMRPQGLDSCPQHLVERISRGKTPVKPPRNRSCKTPTPSCILHGSSTTTA